MFGRRKKSGGGKGSPTDRRRPRGDDERGGGPPRRLGQIVGELLEEPLFRSGVSLGRLAHRWPEVVGSDLARHTEPRALEGGALLVAARTAAWAAQARFLAPEIERGANAVLGAEEVGSVRVVVDPSKA